MFGYCVNKIVDLVVYRQNRFYKNFSMQKLLHQPYLVQIQFYALRQNVETRKIYRTLDFFIKVFIISSLQETNYPLVKKLV